jgi:hypothetical protein
MPEDLITETVRYCGAMDIAVDGIGMTDTNASTHYLCRILQITKKFVERASNECKEQMEAIKRVFGTLS